MNTEDLFRDNLAQTTLHPLNLRVRYASGSLLHLEDGTEVIDFISGIGVSSFGHGHPSIIGALKNQIDKHLHVMVYGELRQESQDLAAKTLCSLLPEKLDSVYFVNSGAEAVDGALKLARSTTARSKIMSVSGGYHGNTFGALSVSSSAARKAPFEPLLPDVHFMPWNDMESLDDIDGSCAAVIVETIQGDAGVRIPSQAWLSGLRKKCDETGALLILDEIQCGMGRTGRFFAFEHYGIEPDILCLGKALGGGLPMGAFVSSRSRMRKLASTPELSHITTFGGHPIPCASSAAALRLLQSLDFREIEKNAKRFHDQIAPHEAVLEVRRIGTYIAVELKDAAAVAFCVEHALSNGLLIYFFLSTPNAFRVAPPLVMDDETWQRATNVLLNTLDAYSSL